MRENGNPLIFSSVNRRYIELVFDDDIVLCICFRQKHRNSSKFSLQSWVGGFSGRNASSPFCGQSSLSENNGNSRDKRRYQHARGGENYAVHSQRSITSSADTVSNEDKQNVRYSDECIVKPNTECPKPSPPGVGISSGGNKYFEKLPQKDEDDVVHNSNRGRLEDNGVPHPDNSSGAGIKFGAIEEDNLMVCRESEKDRNLVSCEFSHTSSQENKSLAASAPAPAPAVSVSDQMHLVTPKGQQHVDNHKDSDKIMVENVKTPVVSENTADVSNCNDIQNDHVESVIEHCVTDGSSSGVEAEVMVEVQDPIVTTEAGDREIPEASKMEGDSGKAVLIDCNPKSVLAGNSGPKISEGQPASMVSMGDPVVLVHGDTIQDNTSNTRNVNTLGECDTVESKERFRQRLWCFLFENLNRAVDELYLLCELECDVEQMKEAVLVLEEAASDFKDLTTRVEEFESMKRSPFQHNNGAPINLKSDHRRPHALSWEVSMLTYFHYQYDKFDSNVKSMHIISGIKVHRQEW